MEELSPYKELFTTVVPEQGLVAAASCFLQLPILLLMNSNAKATNSIAKVTNSIANGTNSIAKRMNYSISKETNSIAKRMNYSIAKETNSIAKTCNTIYYHQHHCSHFMAATFDFITFFT